MITLEHLLLRFLLNARESVMCASEAQTDFIFPTKIEYFFFGLFIKEQINNFVSRRASFCSAFEDLSLKYHASDLSILYYALTLCMGLWF